MTLESIEKLRESSHLDDDKWTFDDGVVMRMYGSEPNEPGAVNWGEQWRKIADEIEAEIERDYMKLPVDADGVPIHVGDVMKLKQCGERIGTVTAVGKHVEARAWVLPDGKNVSISYIASGIKHVKQRPIEDVLREFILDADCVVCGCGDPEADMTPEEIEQAREAWVAKYAAELRELMDVGE